MAESPRRLLSYRQAYAYVGVGRHRFDAEVRPHLTEIPAPGTQNGAILFDRFELDAWVDDYIAKNGRPGTKKEKQPCPIEKLQVYKSTRASGTSTRKSAATVDFVKLLDQQTTRTPKGR